MDVALGQLLPAQLGVPRSFCAVLRVLSLLRVLRVGKRQAWTPIRSHSCGLGVPVGCGMRHAKRMLKRLKGLKRVTPGERQAGPPRRSHGCGLGVAFACAVGRSEKLLQSFKGFKPFKGFKGLRVGKRQAWTLIRSH